MRMRMRKNSWAQSVAGFALGLGVGVALGVLFAPMSGEDMRDYVRGTAEDAIGEATNQARRFTRRAKTAASEVIDDTVREAIGRVDRVAEHLTDAADATAKAYEKARKASA
jgi:gas vesicle protein